MKRPADVRDEISTSLERYALGLLSDAEAEQLEQEYFVTAEAQERLEEVERHLIAAYVRKELPSLERGAFERHFLGSRENREITALALAAAELASRKRPVVLGWLNWIRRPAESFWFAPAFTAISAAALLVCGVLWITLQNREAELQGVQSRLSAASEARERLEKQIAGMTAVQPMTASGLPDTWREQSSRAMGDETVGTIPLVFSAHKMEVRVIPVTGGGNVITAVLSSKGAEIGSPLRLAPIRSGTGAAYVSLAFSADALAGYLGQTVDLALTGENGFRMLYRIELRPKAETNP